MTGTLLKMSATLGAPVEYTLRLSQERIPLNPHLGKTIALTASGDIYCIACARKTKKSFGQGYCYPCFTTLARCDACIVRPELCHYAAGTCREPAWAEAECLIPHVVYLAASSGLKVGITRHHQIPTRWIDQGAVRALPILKVGSRLHSGLVEVALKAFVADKTDWRAMLKGDPEQTDLREARDRILGEAAPALGDLRARLGDDAVMPLPDAQVVDIAYPVLRYPAKVKSLSFEKTPVVEGTLEGIKGQYLLLDTGVINLRNAQGYEVSFRSA